MPVALGAGMGPCALPRRDRVRLAAQATLTHGPLAGSLATRGVSNAALSGLLKGQWGPAMLHLGAGEAQAALPGRY